MFYFALAYLVANLDKIRMLHLRGSPASPPGVAAASGAASSADSSGDSGPGNDLQASGKAMRAGAHAIPAVPHVSQASVATVGAIVRGGARDYAAAGGSSVCVSDLGLGLVQHNVLAWRPVGARVVTWCMFLLGVFAIVALVLMFMLVGHTASASMADVWRVNQWRSMCVGGPGFPSTASCRMQWRAVTRCVCVVSCVCVQHLLGVGIGVCGAVCLVRLAHIR